MRQAGSPERALPRYVPIISCGSTTPEYAQPLVPPWMPVLALLLILAWPPPRTRTTAVAIAVPVARLCGSGWLVATRGPSGYTIRAIGTPAGAPLPCAIVVDPGTVLHASGDAAWISPGNARGVGLFLPEGGWWGVPLTWQSTLQVVPFHSGSHLQLTIYSWRQFAALH